MNQKQQYISTSLPFGHSDNNNTSFIIGTNQENKSVAAYISSPPPLPTPIAAQPSSSPHIIMDDNVIFTIDGNTNNDSTITGSDSDSDVMEGSLTMTEGNKKKSVRSRFSALKNSKLRATVCTKPPTNFIFLPSSSTPIPNSLPPLEKRHSTSSSTLIKSNHKRHSQQKQNTKIPTSSQKNNQASSTHHLLTSNKSSNVSPQCTTLQYEEKHDRYPTSSSSPSLTRPKSLTPSQASSTADLMESLPLGTEYPPSPSSTHLVDPAPHSRFLAAFQKIYQQRLSQDNPTATITTTRRSMDLSPLTPTASTIGTGSKSTTSFTEKIKNKFKPTLVPSLKPPPPPTTTTTTTTTIETRKTRASRPNSVAATIPMPRPSQSSTPSIINRSWSQFSRPFASSNSVKRPSLHLPKQQETKPNDAMEGQILSMNGKRTTTRSSSRHHRNHRPKLLSQQQQHQQQRFIQHPSASNLRGHTTKASLASLDHPHQQHNGTTNTTFKTDNNFDTIREDATTMTLSTCSTSSQRSSTSSSLSVTASSSTSASSSPISLSMDILPSSHDSKKSFVFSSSNNKSYAMSTCRPPSIVLEIENTNKSSSAAAARSISSSSNGIGMNKPTTVHRPLINTTTHMKKKKRHVRFVPTAKVQDTFSKHDYDRASDPYAICTRLTAHLAQQIKDELNAFKLEEMLVHHQSRCNTQFFM